MKIVINLDEYQLEHCKRHVAERYSNRLEEAIANGKPLDDVLGDIRAKIESKEMIETTSEREFYNMALNDVLKIIDAYNGVNT